MYTNMSFFIFIVCGNTIASMIKTNPFFDFAGGSRRAPNPERPVARSAGCSEKPAQPTKTKNSSRGTRGGQETKTQQTRSGSVARPGNFFPFFPLLFLLVLLNVVYRWLRMSKTKTSLEIVFLICCRCLTDVAPLHRPP